MTDDFDVVKKGESHEPSFKSGFETGFAAGWASACGAIIEGANTIMFLPKEVKNDKKY